MKAYGLDLRQRIAGAVQAGESKSAVGRRFGVERSTVRRYMQRLEATGSLAPAPIPGDTPTIPPTQYPHLRAQLDATPDAILAMHCATWAAECG